MAIIESQLDSILKKYKCSIIDVRKNEWTREFIYILQNDKTQGINTLNIPKQLILNFDMPYIETLLTQACKEISSYQEPEASHAWAGLVRIFNGDKIERFKVEWPK